MLSKNIAAWLSLTVRYVVYVLTKYCHGYGVHTVVRMFACKCAAGMRPCESSKGHASGSSTRQAIPARQGLRTATIVSAFSKYTQSHRHSLALSI